MKKIALFVGCLIVYASLCFVVLCTTGCTYNHSYVCGDGSNPTVTTTKTVTTSPELQGNVPIQGGTVSNPQQTQTNPVVK